MKREVVTGISFTQALVLVFVVLKLTDNIDWSWFWVLSPLWIPLGVFLGLGAVFIVGGVLLWLIAKALYPFVRNR